ncbi:MAG: glycosyltransferase family 2 protein [Verrucomicrobia bacterium]|nr:glycosyltransferase family 2 protein [Verrucomicrobiota bacterium]
MSPQDPDIWISVIIVCHNDGAWLPRCVESIRTQSIAPHIELILADNASGDGTDQIARTLIAGWHNALFLPTGGDLGFCAAHNRGADVARGRYLYLFSPDTWLEPDCLEQLYTTAEREQAAAAGTLMLEYDDNTVQARGSHGFDLFGNPVSPRRGRDPHPLFCIAGFYFIRKDVFVRMGKLDETFFMYGEEMDLSWRLWISGERVVPVMTARVHHRGAAGVNPAGGMRAVEHRTSTQKRFLANRNYLLVIAKNCQHVLLLLLLPCTLLILLEGLLTLLISRSGTLARDVSLRPLAAAWRLRTHIRNQRRHIRTLRRHGDFHMLRFLRPGFGRSAEIRTLLRRGFPRFTRNL